MLQEELMERFDDIDNCEEFLESNKISVVSRKHVL
jgi:hypothetical protein